METAAVIEIISSLGFPIACVIALGWFILKIYNQSIVRENELRTEIKENQKINGKFAEIINRHSAELGEIKNDVKEIKEDIITLTEKIV